MAAASGSAIRAGRAFVELYSENSKLIAGLHAAEKQIQEFGERVAGYGKRFAAYSSYAIVPFVISQKVFSDLDDTLRAVKAVTRASMDQFDRVSKKAKFLGRTTSFTSKEVAESMLVMGRAGFNTMQIDNMIAHTMNLSRATRIPIEDATNILSDTMRQFNLDSRETERVADVLVATANGSAQSLIDLGEAFKYVAPVAKEFRVSLEDTAKVVGTLANFGIKGSMAGTATRNIMARMANEDVQGLYSQIGVPVVDNTGQWRNFAEIIQDVGRAVAGLPDDKKLAIFDQLFGLRAIAGGIKLTGKSFDELNQSIDNAVGTANRTAREMDAGIGGSFRMFMSALEGIGEAVGQVITPFVQKWTDGLTEVMNGIADWIYKNGEFIVSMTKTIVSSIALGGAMIAAGIAIKASSVVISASMAVLWGAANIVTLSVRALGVAFVLATSPIAALIAGLGAIAVVSSDASSSIGGKLAGAFKKLTNGAFDGCEGIADVTKVILGNAKNLTAYMANAFTKVASALSKITFGDIVNGIESAYGTIVSVVGGIMSAIVSLVASSYVSGAFNWIAEGVRTAFSVVVKTIQVTFNTVDTVIRAIASGIVTAFSWAADGVKYVYNAVAGLASSIKYVVEVIVKVADTIVSLFQVTLTAINPMFLVIASMFSAIYNIVRSVISGIVGFIEGAVSKIVGVFVSVAGAIVSAFRFVANNVKAVYDNIVAWAYSMASKVMSAVSGITSFVKSVFAKIASAIGPMADALSEFFSDFRNVVKTIVGIAALAVAFKILRGTILAVSYVVNGLVKSFSFLKIAVTPIFMIAKAFGVVVSVAKRASVAVAIMCVKIAKNITVASTIILTRIAYVAGYVALYVSGMVLRLTGLIIIETGRAIAFVIRGAIHMVAVLSGLTYSLGRIFLRALLNIGQLPALIASITNSVIGSIGRVVLGFRNLLGNVSTVVLRIYLAVRTAITNSANFMASMFQSIYNMIRDISSAATTAIATMWHALNQAIRANVTIISATVQAIANALSGSIAAIIALIITLMMAACVGAITVGMIALMAVVATGVIKIVGLIASTIKDLFVKAFIELPTILLKIFGKMLSGVIAALGKMFSSITSVVSSAMSNIGVIITSALAQLGPIIAAIAGNLAAAFDSNIDAIKARFNELVKTSEDVFKAFKAAWSVKDIGSIMNLLWSYIKHVWTTGVTSLTDILYTWVKDSAKPMAEFAKTIATSMISAVGEIKKAFYGVKFAVISAFDDIREWVFNCVKDMRIALVDMFYDVCAKVDKMLARLNPVEQAKAAASFDYSGYFDTIDFNIDLSAALSKSAAHREIDGMIPPKRYSDGMQSPDEYNRDVDDATDKRKKDIENGIDGMVKPTEDWAENGIEGNKKKRDDSKKDLDSAVRDAAEAPGRDAKKKRDELAIEYAEEELQNDPDRVRKLALMARNAEFRESLEKFDANAAEIKRLENNAEILKDGKTPAEKKEYQNVLKQIEALKNENEGMRPGIEKGFAEVAEYKEGDYTKKSQESLGYIAKLQEQRDAIDREIAGNQTIIDSKTSTDEEKEEARASNADLEELRIQADARIYTEISNSKLYENEGAEAFNKVAELAKEYGIYLAGTENENGGPAWDDSQYPPMPPEDQLTKFQPPEYDEQQLAKSTSELISTRGTFSGFDIASLGQADWELDESKKQTGHLKNIAQNTRDVNDAIKNANALFTT